MMSDFEAFAAAALQRATEFSDTVVEQANALTQSARPGLDAWWAALAAGEPAALATTGVAVLALLLLMLLWRSARPSPKQVPAKRAEPGATLASQVRGPSRLGWGAVVVLVGGVAAMGMAAPMAGAVIASGVVSPDGNRKQVQHLEGGIVHSILVREGDRVEAGQPLLVMDDTRARTELDELQERFIHFKAVEARLLAEQAGEAKPIMADDPSGLGLKLDLTKALAVQADLLASRKGTHEAREAVLAKRGLQLREENRGITDLMASQERQLELLARERQMVQTLLDKGYERLPRMLALQRAEAELSGSLASNRASIARNDQAVGQTETELLTLRQERAEKIDDELTTIKAELSSLRSRLPALVDVMDRTTIAAPVSGTVMNVRVSTNSGVIRPGDVLMDVVPSQAQLIVDAKVKPIDIDNVQGGTQAKLVLSAFTQRNLPQIFGTVRSVSADHLTDERTGESYFLAKVEVSPEELRKLGAEHQLVPGMPAEVYLLTAERTPFDYLITPFIQSISRSFRES